MAKTRDISNIVIHGILYGFRAAMCEQLHDEQVDKSQIRAGVNGGCFVQEVLKLFLYHMLRRSTYIATQGQHH